jgi:hypothetical protein
MKKLLGVTVLMGCLVWVAPPTSAAAKEYPSGPFRICFWPRVWYWPAHQNIYGLSLGLGTYNSKDPGTIVGGLDLSFVSMTDRLDGVRLTLVSKAETLNGVELAFANLSNKVNGAQISAVNMTSESNFFQLGLLNQSTKGKGVQVGLINIMDNGFFPIFPIVNWGFDKK